MLEALAEPFRDEGTRRALAELCLVGAAGGALGCWVVLYRLPYAAESLAHAMLPGLVIAALAGVPLVLGGGAGVLAAALAIALARRVPRVGADAATAVVVTSMLGLGALLALAPRTPAGLSDLLFGDVLAVTGGDLALAGAALAAVGAALVVLHPALLAVGFDRPVAGALGRAPLAVDAALAVLVAVVLLVATRGLGNLLVIALLVAPAVAARSLTRRAAPMILVAGGLALAGAVAGLEASYHLRTAAGASVALALVAVTALAAAAGGLRARSAA